MRVIGKENGDTYKRKPQNETNGNWEKNKRKKFIKKNLKLDGSWGKLRDIKKKRIEINVHKVGVFLEKYIKKIDENLIKRIRIRKNENKIKGRNWLQKTSKWTEVEENY